MKLTPMAAGEVKVGWRIKYDGKVSTVVGKQFGPPKDGELERTVTLWLEDDWEPMRGDEGQTVYQVTEESG